MTYTAGANPSERHPIYNDCTLSGMWIFNIPELLTGQKHIFLHCDDGLDSI